MTSIRLILVAFALLAVAVMLSGPWGATPAVGQMDRPGGTVTNPKHVGEHDDHDHGDDGDHDHDDADHDDDWLDDDISTEAAMEAVQAAIEACEERDLKMNIAVVDAGGNLKAFARMDGAWLGSIDIAIKKAKTARFFDMPTGEIGKLSQPGGPLYNIEASNNGLITFPGGIPIKNEEGEVVGAIGVSGSTVENDHAIAEAGLEALK